MRIADKTKYASKRKLKKVLESEKLLHKKQSINVKRAYVINITALLVNLALLAYNLLSS